MSNPFSTNPSICLNKSVWRTKQQTTWKGFFLLGCCICSFSVDLGWCFCDEPWPWVLGRPLDLQPGEVPGWTGAAGGTWSPQQEEVGFTSENFGNPQYWEKHWFISRRSHFVLGISDCSRLELEWKRALGMSWRRTDFSWSSRPYSKPSGSCPPRARWRPTTTSGPSCLLWSCRQVIMKL